MKKTAIILMSLFMLSCSAQEENIEPSVSVDEIQVKERIRKAPEQRILLGQWEADSDNHLITTNLVIDNLSDSLILVNGDTMDLLNGNQFIETFRPNQVFQARSGTLSNNVLTYCAMYADPVTLTTYYICAEYR